MLWFLIVLMKNEILVLAKNERVLGFAMLLIKAAVTGDSMDI